MTFLDHLKVAFFSESAISFSNLPISSKKIFQKTILSLKFKILAHNSIMLWAGILNFKFRIVFWNIFFLRLGDLKNELHFLKKTTFRYVVLKKGSAKPIYFLIPIWIPWECRSIGSRIQNAIFNWFEPLSFLCISFHTDPKLTILFRNCLR